MFSCLAFNFGSYANSAWVFIDTNKIGNSFFIDNLSIQTSGNSKTFWVRSNLKERTWGDLSSKNQYTINCSTREIIGRHYMFYDDINNLGRQTSNSTAIDAKWTPIAPDTISGSFFEHVCR